jgi:hypothetical protein
MQLLSFQILLFNIFFFFLQPPAAAAALYHRPKETLILRLESENFCHICKKALLFGLKGESGELLECNMRA